jgi:hypothetical protein
MPEVFNWNDFSAGWCPSDDALNGRKNGLLRMENVELDLNGAIQMSGGTTRQLSVFTNTLHTIYQKYINGTPYIYSADTTGLVFRGNTQIETGGSATRACFNAAYNYVFGFSGNKRFKDDGTTATDLGIIGPSAGPTVVVGAAGILTGDYEYCQVNVLVNGSYRAKSVRSAINTVSPSLQVVTVTPQNPSVPSSTANEAWIFRRGVNLDTWYRIARVTSFGAFTDNMSDYDALALGITLNDFLLPVNSTGIPDAIISCVGPVYGRMIYFTAKQIYFGDINSPDSTDSRTTMNVTGASGSETFKWAIKVAKNTVLVGTDRDVYILSGTYVQLPDGFLDVSLDPLGVSDPPIGIDVALYQNSAVYMSKSGWVACNTSGNIVNLCFPNTDLLYKGEATFECGAVTIDLTGATRYSCTIVKNKLFCIVPVGGPLASGSFTSIHTEVYDFQRKYWRVAYVNLSPKMYVAHENGSLLGFDDTDKFIKVYDDITRRLDDGAQTRQTVQILSGCFDFNLPTVRKDLYTLGIAGGTGSSLFGVVIGIGVDGHTGYEANDISTTAFKVNDTGVGYYQFRSRFDIQSISGASAITPCRDIQFRVSGQTTDLRFKELSLSYDKRPPQLTFLRLLNLGLDSINKKRIRTINFIIDTLGNDITFTPIVDGVAHSSSIFNTTRKSAVAYTFFQDSDCFGTDFSATLQSSASLPFEFYEVLPPDVVYQQPGPKVYNTIGEIEILRYGKIKALEIRIDTLAVTSLPYIIYLDGISLISSSIDIATDGEKICSIPLPKTIAGSLLKIDIGPIGAGRFRHIATRIQIAKSGLDTEEKWVFLDGKGAI